MFGSAGQAFEVFSDLFACSCCWRKTSMSSHTEWNNETRSDSQSLLLALSQFSFIVALKVKNNLR